MDGLSTQFRLTCIWKPPYQPFVQGHHCNQLRRLQETALPCLTAKPTRQVASCFHELVLISQPGPRNEVLVPVKGPPGMHALPAVISIAFSTCSLACCRCLLLLCFPLLLLSLLLLGQTELSCFSTWQSKVNGTLTDIERSRFQLERMPCPFK